MGDCVHLRWLKDVERRMPQLALPHRLIIRINTYEEY